MNENSSYSITSQLEKTFVHGSSMLKLFKPLLISRLKVLEKQFASLLAILKEEPAKIQLTAFDRYCIKNAFPMILLSEAEENIELLSFSTREYRAKTEMTLGKEITGIAVEGEKERSIINAYLLEHNIQNVGVVLFNDLSIGKRPKPQGGDLSGSGKSFLPMREMYQEHCVKKCVEKSFNLKQKLLQ
jgi:hypothetical protein